MKYPINEYFHSIQGEAEFTGTPAFFIRFQGCDVGCKFCDTKYSWAFNAKKVSEDQGKSPSSCWSPFTKEELINISNNARHFVITGGEPCLHDLRELTIEIHEEGSVAQVETSGTAAIRVHPSTWVTVSPKIDNPGNKPIVEEAIKRADEFKFPIMTWEDVILVDRFVDQYNLFEMRASIWLQPISEDKQAVEICYTAARERGWRISAQVHKYLNLR